MLSHRLRRWLNIIPTFGQRFIIIKLNVNLPIYKGPVRDRDPYRSFSQAS